MKRAMILVACRGAVAAACTSAAPTSPSPNSAGSPVQITLWHGYGDIGSRRNGLVNYEAKSINDLWTRSTTTHPDVHVDASIVGSNDHASRS